MKVPVSVQLPATLCVYVPGVNVAPDSIVKGPSTSKAISAVTVPVLNFNPLKVEVFEPVIEKVPSRTTLAT